VVDIPNVNGPLEFTYDEEWLSIVKATNDYMTTKKEQDPLPSPTEMKR